MYNFHTTVMFIEKTRLRVIGLDHENAIAIESEARYPFSDNVYYVTMEITCTFQIPEFARKKRNCIVT